MARLGGDANKNSTTVLDGVNKKGAWQAQLKFEGQARPKREVANG